MFKSTLSLLTAASGLALAAGASPAFAQAADQPPAPAAAKPARLQPMGVKAKGIIRPFGKKYRQDEGGISDVDITASGGLVRSTAGRIRAFEDNVGVSAGRIRAFAGEVGAFAGRIRAFSSDVNLTTSLNTTFWGADYAQLGAISASAGRIRAFDGNIEASAGRIRAFAGRIRAFDGSLLTFDAAPTDYRGISAEIDTMAAEAKLHWGATILAGTGKTFEAAFLDPMLKRWGVTLGTAESVAGMNEVDLELFLLDWRDNLTIHSGANSVDHWMRSVNWSPLMTQNLTGGDAPPVKIGLIDFSVGGDQKANVISRGGELTDSGGHGTAISSLLVGAHDGKAVMGFAPKSKIYTYNPFDSSYTADWEDIKAGVLSLAGQGVSVVNLSLGVPDHTFHGDWRIVLGDGDVRSKMQKSLFVVAAGNEGVTQTTNVNMKDAFDTGFLVVGSVDPNNNISTFSNRPGNTCLTDDGVCKNYDRWVGTNAWFSEKSDYLKESGLLMNRFIVAPGEFMLVDDGQGGVTRVSGTSFATPLVSGAIALIADRWPWLMDKPRDVAHIILTSATDLGEKGTDGTYGRGMLNVEAALAPLDWSKVTFRQSLNGGKLNDTTLATLRGANALTRSTWDLNRAYFYVYERTTESHRDFYIPMSSKLVGQTVGSNKDQMNYYLQSRFLTALGAPSSFAGSGTTGFAFGPNRFSAPAGGFGDLQATVSLAPKAWRPGLRQSDAPFDTALALRTPDGRVGLRFGGGSGGADVDGRQGFGLQSDYDVQHGGANPYLGLASGGGYVAADVALTDRLTVSVGTSGQQVERDVEQLGVEDRLALGRLEAYRANASLLSVGYRAFEWLNATASYTMLDEGTGLLGVQSLDQSDLRHGTTTDAATIGADVTPGHGLAVSLSATMGRTRADDLDRQNMGVAEGGLLSSAFQVAVSKVGLFDGADRARVTFAQPLHVESGELAAKQLRVVDRRTGELGEVVESFDLNGGGRRFVAEAMYGRSVMDGTGELNLFGRANLQGQAVDGASFTVGGSFRLGF